MHTTNYYNTFIEIAEDCKLHQGEIPPMAKDKKTIALLQFEMLYENPYKYTSDEVLFGVFALKKEFEQNELPEQKNIFSPKDNHVLEPHHSRKPMVGAFIAMPKEKSPCLGLKQKNTKIFSPTLP